MTFEGHSDRKIIWDQPEYTASTHVADLGEGQLMTFFHVDVYFLSKEILQDMLQRWQVFRKTVPIVLFAMGEVDDEKFHRFVSLVGFQKLKEIPCTDGKTRRLYVSWPPQEAQEQ